MQHCVKQIDTRALWAWKAWKVTYLCHWPRFYKERFWRAVNCCLQLGVECLLSGCHWVEWCLMGNWDSWCLWWWEWWLLWYHSGRNWSLTKARFNQKGFLNHTVTRQVHPDELEENVKKYSTFCQTEKHTWSWLDIKHWMMTDNLRWRKVPAKEK